MLQASLLFSYSQSALSKISPPVAWSYQLLLITFLHLERVYLTYLHYVYDPSAVLYQLYTLQLFGFCYCVEIFEQDHTEIFTCPLKTEQFTSWKAKSVIYI